MEFKVELILIGAAFLLFSGLSFWIDPLLSILIVLLVIFGVWGAINKWAFVRLKQHNVQRNSDFAKIKQELTFTQLTFDQARIGIFYAYLDGRMLYANQTALACLHDEMQEVLDGHLWDLIPEIKPEEWGQFVLEITEVGSKEIDGFYQRKGGDLVPTETHINLVSFEQDRFLLGFVQDVSEKKAVQQALKESDERYYGVAAAMGEGVIVKERDGHISFANSAAEKILGLTAEQMMGLKASDPSWKAIREDGSPLTYEEYPSTLTLQTGQAQKGIIMGVNKPDGSLSWISINTQPQFSQSGSSFDSIIVTLHDITELKQTQKALDRTRERNQALLQAIPDVMFRLGADGTFLDFHLHDQEDVLIPTEEYLGKDISTFLPPSVTSLMENYCERALQTGQMQRFELQLPVDKQMQFREARMVPIKGDEVVMIVRDTTELKEAETALKENLAFMELILDANPHYMYWKDLDLNIIGGNRNFITAAGLEEKEAIKGKSDFDLPWTEQETNLYRSQDLQVIKTGKPLLNLIRTQTRFDGKIMTIDSSKFPLHDAKGNVIGVFGFYQDITDRVEAEAAVKESEEKYRMLFNLMDEGVAINKAIYNDDGEMDDYRIIDVNPAFERHSIYSKDQALGAIATELYEMTPEYIHGWWSEHRHRTGVGVVEMFHEPSDRWFVIRSTPIKADRFATIFVDISSRKKAEMQLQKFNARLEVLHQLERLVLMSPSITELLEKLPDYIQKVLPYKRLVIASIHPDKQTKTYLAVCGAKKEDFLEGTQLPMDQTWFEEVEGKTRIRLVQDIRQLSDPKPEEKQLLNLGIQSYISYPFILQDQVIGLMSIGREGKSEFLEDEIDIGNEIANILALAFHQTSLNQALRDSEKKLRRLNAGLEQRVQTRTLELNNRILEVERLNRQLETANKELEGFSYSVSHDLRAPLRHINGFLGLLRKREKDRLDPTSSRYLGITLESVSKMTQLIDDLLAFSRTNRTQISIEQVNLEDLIVTVRNELLPDYEGRNIDWLIHPLASIEADPNLLKIVCTNLLSNAIKYTGTRKLARIEIGMGTQEDKLLPAFGDSPMNTEDNIIYVKDNGVGFDEKYANKLFGVFQRLHRSEEFEGTGIGLATVRRIVHRHGGRVWAKSDVDKGATFYFSLPKSQLPEL